MRGWQEGRRGALGGGRFHEVCVSPAAEGLRALPGYGASCAFSTHGCLQLSSMLRKAELVGFFLLQIKGNYFRF